MKLLIGGVDHTALVWDDGQAIQISQDINAHGTMGLRLRDFGSLCTARKGQAVQLYSPDPTVDLMFAGSVEDLEVIESMPVAGWVDYGIRCVDHNAIPSRFIAAAVYEGVTAGAIVRDLIDTYLAGEGVTDDGVEDGPTIDSFLVNYDTVAEALTTLSNLTGFGWRIDVDKVLWFTDRTTTAAPFPIDDATTLILGASVVDSRDQYRNRQYVIAGSDLTDSRVESFVGDGTRRTFTLQFPVGKAPTHIKVNGVDKTIGIGQVESGKDFYWNEGSYEISQDQGGAVLTGAATLAVTYQGKFPVIALAQDDVAIAERQAVEGGSGVYDHRDDETSINSETMALATAQALLARYAGTKTVKLALYELDGLRAGMLLPITRTVIGVSGEFLITSIQATCTWKNNQDYWSYQVTAVEGAAVGGWQQFFIALAAATKQKIDASNQVLALLRLASEGLILGDSTIVTVGGAETRIGYGTIGFAEIG